MTLNLSLTDILASLGAKQLQIEALENELADMRAENAALRAANEATAQTESQDLTVPEAISRG
ncbi:MAG: hypothetical protein V4515_12325 [Chloroflexota bacterium]